MMTVLVTFFLFLFQICSLFGLGLSPLQLFLSELVLTWVGGRQAADSQCLEADLVTSGGAQSRLVPGRTGRQAYSDRAGRPTERTLLLHTPPHPAFPSPLSYCVTVCQARYPTLSKIIRCIHRLVLQSGCSRQGRGQRQAQRVQS